MKTLLSIAATLLMLAATSTPRLCASQSNSPAPIDTKTYENRSFAAYMSALSQGKYTVILFHAGSYDGFSRRIVKKMQSPKFAKHADRVVFSVADEDIDKGAMQLAEALGVVRYPTLVILKTNILHVNPRQIPRNDTSTIMR